MFVMSHRTDNDSIGGTDQFNVCNVHTLIIYVLQMLYLFFQLVSLFLNSPSYNSDCLLFNHCFISSGQSWTT